LKILRSKVPESFKERRYNRNSFPGADAVSGKHPFPERGGGRRDRPMLASATKPRYRRLGEVRGIRGMFAGTIHFQGDVPYFKKLLEGEV